jgi:phytoene/squalene synthetase
LAGDNLSNLCKSAKNSENGNLVSASTIHMAGAAVEDMASAQVQTRQLAQGHYENFSVVSLLLPRNLRQDFSNIYAFCRVADDLSDEVGDANESLRLLEDFRIQTLDCFAGRAKTPVFVALSQTIQRHDLPPEPFLVLFDAFNQDKRVER